MKKRNKGDIFLDNYLEAITKIVNRVQTKGARDKWPLPKLHIWDCEIYISPYLLRRAYSYFKEAEAKGISEKDIAKIYQYPTYFARLPFIYVFRATSDLNEKEMKWLGYKIATILNVFYGGKHKSNLTRGNILWNKKTLDANLDKLRFKKLRDVENDKYRKILSQIEGKLYLYSELLYNDSPNIAYEIHGPYKLGDKRLLVREYQNLKFEFWPFSQKFPFDKITIYEIFGKNKIKVGIDMHGRLYSDKILSQTISSYSIMVDGKNINNFKQLEKISDILNIFLQKGAIVKSKLNKKKIIKSFAYVRSFFLKPLADVLKKDWRPPKEILNKIEKLELSEKEKKFNKVIFATKIGVKERFDPRIKI